FLQRARQVVNIHFRAEEPRADADRSLGKGAEGTMNVRGTMQARADSDLEGLIENGADLRSRQHLAAETQRADTPFGIAMAEDLESYQRLQLLPKSLGKLHFMTADLVGSLLLHEADAGCQSGDAEDVRGAALEEVRELARLRFAGRIAAGATLTPGTDPG